MVPGFFCTCRIKRTHKLRIGAKLFQHVSMLAAHRAVNCRGAGSDCDGSRGPDCDRAIDHRQCRLEKLDVPGSLADKVLDLEWVADMQYIDLIDRPHRRDIHTDRVIMFGNELEQGS